MKKLIKKLLCITVGIALISTMLTGCGNRVKVSVFKDISAIGLTHLMEKQSERGNKLKGNYKFTISITAADAAKLLDDGKANIAVIPAELAARYAFADDSYVCLAYVSTVNHYIVGVDDKVKKMVDLVGKTVYVKDGKSAAASILEYVYDVYGLNSRINTKVLYVNKNGELRNVLQSGNTNGEYILANQPFLSDLNKQNSASRQIINISDEFEENSDAKAIGTCVIAKRKYVEKHEELVREFLSEYTTSIEKCMNRTQTAELASKYEIITDEIAATSILYDDELKMVRGEDMKKDMTAYYKILNSINRQCVPKVPTDEFYYTFK